MAPFLRAFAFVALTFCVATATRAQTGGRLLFLNMQTGDYQVAGVDVNGFVHAALPGTIGPAGITNIAPTNVGTLTYNSSTGAGRMMVVDGFGNINTIHTASFSAGWKYIVGYGGYLFFYDGGSTGAIVAMEQGGFVDHQTWSSTKFSTWTNVVPTDDYLIFYNVNTGLLAETIISPVFLGALEVNNFGVQHAGPGYSVVAPIGDNVVLYNSTTGHYEIVGMFFVGNGNDFPDRRSKGNLPKFYGAIIPVSGHVVFYSYGSGDTTVGYLQQNGSLVKTQHTTLPIYTSFIESGDYAVGYDAISGLLDVYGIGPDNTLVLRSSETFTTGFTSLTATLL